MDHRDGRAAAVGGGLAGGDRRRAFLRHQSRRFPLPGAAGLAPGDLSGAGPAACVVLRRAGAVGPRPSDAISQRRPVEPHRGRRRHAGELLHPGGRAPGGRLSCGRPDVDLPEQLRPASGRGRGELDAGDGRCGAGPVPGVEPRARPPAGRRARRAERDAGRRHPGRGRPGRFRRRPRHRLRGSGR